MVLAAVAQICSTSSLSHNGKLAAKLIHEAAAKGAKVLFFPEASDYIAGSAQESVEIVKPVETSDFIAEIKSALSELPLDKRPEISVGVHEPTEGKKRVKNTLLWLDQQGQVVHRYQKVHLFDVDIKNGPILKESASVEPGNSILPPFDSPIGKIGSAICYDIRFPEQALRLRTLGAQVILFPSAFTMRTGQAHWEVLARSRAIDTQSYVIMAAQVGQHDSLGKRQSYGHALVVDPWGSVIAQAPDTDYEPRIILADIDLDAVDKVRRNMPLWEQRRPDVFGYEV